MAKKYTAISKYYRTFSGTDTLAFIMLPNCTPIVLGSLTTISYSIFRNKKPVINIGRTNINGVTRGSRIYAGTMIFTLINQHWLREVQRESAQTNLEDGTNDGMDVAGTNWLRNLRNIKADELPLFDIMIVSANEYGSAVSMYIYGIDYTDEAQTISVEDLFTENTFSFIARDVDTFKEFNAITGPTRVQGGIPNAGNGITQRFHIIDSSLTNLDDIGKLEKELAASIVSQKLSNKMAKTLSRDLYYSTTKMMIGTDVSDVQNLLNQTGRVQELEVNGIFDETMDNIVRMYQSIMGLEPNGIVDNRTYMTLLNDNNIETYEKTAVVVNKNGAFVYRFPSLSEDIVDVKPYQSIVNISEIVSNEDDGEFTRFYKTPTGYIALNDLYSAYNAGAVIEFPNIKYQDTNSYVTMAQSMLSSIYPQYSNITGVFDTEMQMWIKKLQEDNNLEVTGTIDYETWLILKEMSGNPGAVDDNFKISYSQPPGEYVLNKKEVSERLDDFTLGLSCENYTNVKITVIAKYGNNQVVFPSSVQLKDNKNISLKDYQNAFLYNIEQGQAPDSVDLFVYPYNKKAYKWTFDIKG